MRRSRPSCSTTGYLTSRVSRSSAGSTNVPPRATLPVLVVTGDGELAQRIAGLGAGATDYIVKPVAPDELVARLAAHLRAQAVWFDLLDRQLRKRAELVSALFSIAPPRLARRDRRRDLRSARAAARGIDGAAVTRLDQRGRMSVLASKGDRTIAATLRHLGGTPAAYVLARAEQPWIERGVAADGEPVQVAIAPMRLGGVSVGLLALAALDGPDSGRFDGRQLLADAIDVAGVATGLLGLSLHARTEDDRHRHDLVDIVRGRQFQSAFQPMVDLTDGTVIGYEALTLFDDGISPDRRFAEATRLGIDLDLELATIETAIESSDAMSSELFLSVNVTPRLVLERSAEVGALFRASGRSFVLELTETDAGRGLRSPAVGPRRVRSAGAGFDRRCRRGVRQTSARHPAPTRLREARPDLGDRHRCRSEPPSVGGGPVALRPGHRVRSRRRGHRGGGRAGDPCRPRRSRSARASCSAGHRRVYLPVGR